MEPFKYTFRVRYSEVDPQCVVFNARYLDYADIVVTEFYRDLRTKGVPVDIEFHIRHAEIDFLAPIRADELIEGRLTVEAVGNTSVTKQIGLFGAADASPRAEIRLVAVHVDLPDGKPRQIPDTVRQAFGHSPKVLADG